MKSLMSKMSDHREYVDQESALITNCSIYCLICIVIGRFVNFRSCAREYVEQETALITE